MKENSVRVRLERGLALVGAERSEVCQACPPHEIKHDLWAQATEHRDDLAARSLRLATVAREAKQESDTLARGTRHCGKERVRPGLADKPARKELRASHDLGLLRPERPATALL
eukprot:Amastigsp_a677609_14.p7 type:complete len:114 gc:universal Amastigsp_a677609_14:1194-853(-)